MAKNDSLKKALTEKPEPPKEKVHFTTGGTLLDLMIGGGEGMGWKAGTLANIVGINQGGKSQQASECVAHNVHKRGPKFWWEYIIRERRWSFDTEKLFGVKVADLDAYCPTTLEDWDGFIGSLMDKAKAPGIIVTDTLDAFSTHETEARADDRVKQIDRGKEDIKQKGSYTIKTGAPSFLSETLRIRCDQAQATNTLLLVLSQIRMNVNAELFESKLQRNGGAALDHWCDSVLWVKPVRMLYVGGKTADGKINKAMPDYREYGVVVEAWMTKCSTPRPYRRCRYTVLFDYGIDNIGSNLDYLFDLRGMDGKLLGVANAINWDSKASKTLATLKQFAEERGILEAHKDYLKETEGNRTIRLDLLDKWLGAHEVHGDEYNAQFASETLGRDDLIAKIEADPKLEKELEQRVIAKWEAIEANARTNRRPKFG